MNAHDPASYLETIQRYRRGPSRRWLAAQQAASTEPGKMVGWHDALTKLATAYLHRRAGQRPRVEQQDFRLIETAEIIEAETGVGETLQILAIGEVAERNPLQSNLRAATGDMMSLAYHLQQAISKSLEGKSRDILRFEEIAPSIEMYLKLTRQADKFAQIDFKLGEGRQGKTAIT